MLSKNIARVAFSPHTSKANFQKIDRMMSTITNSTRNSQNLINVNVNTLIKKSLQKNGKGQKKENTQNDDCIDAYENAALERNKK